MVEMLCVRLLTARRGALAALGCATRSRFGRAEVEEYVRRTTKRDEESRPSVGTLAGKARAQSVVEEGATNRGDRTASSTTIWVVSGEWNS